jgi:hypothetical protein
MAFAVAHPTISQSAKLTSNASIIAFLPIQISRTQAPNAPHGTKVPADDWGQFKVVRCIITAAEKEYPQIELAPTYRSEDEKPTGKPAASIVMVETDRALSRLGQAAAEGLTRRTACMTSLFTASMIPAGGSIRMLL